MRTGVVKEPNVNPVFEMVDMMQATRSYQANLSVIQSAQHQRHENARPAEVSDHYLPSQGIPDLAPITPQIDDRAGKQAASRKSSSRSATCSNRPTRWLPVMRRGKSD